jgi:hypothetical protein
MKESHEEKNGEARLHRPSPEGCTVGIHTLECFWTQQKSHVGLPPRSKETQSRVLDKCVWSLHFVFLLLLGKRPVATGKSWSFKVAAVGWGRGCISDWTATAETIDK